jgi:hypothetical protein
MFDPKIGRWTSQDPIGFEAGDPNLYRYVGNNPSNDVDPTGLETPTHMNGHYPGGEGPHWPPPPKITFCDHLAFHLSVQLAAINWMTGKRAWTEESALARVRKQIQDWRGTNCDFAANLMQHFIDKKGPTPYQPTQADIDETMTHSESMVRWAIGVSLHSGDEHPKELMPVDFDEDVRWDIYRGGLLVPQWKTDTNMFFAYGGAHLKIRGTAILNKKPRVEGPVQGAYYDAEVEVTLTDTWDFKESGALGLRPVLFDAYDATQYLQLQCDYRQFDHKLTFKKKYTDLFVQDARRPIISPPTKR